MSRLRRRRESHHLHRRPGGDSEDPQSPEGQRRNERHLPIAREPGAAGWTVRLISKTDCLAQEAAPCRRGRVTVCQMLRMWLWVRKKQVNHKRQEWYSGSIQGNGRRRGGTQTANSRWIWANRAFILPILPFRRVPNGIPRFTRLCCKRGSNACSSVMSIPARRYCATISTQRSGSRNYPGFSKSGDQLSAGAGRHKLGSQSSEGGLEYCVTAFCRQPFRAISNKF